MSINGYVENINMKKTLFTEEQIKNFENDVNNGEYIDNLTAFNKYIPLLSNEKTTQSVV